MTPNNRKKSCVSGLFYIHNNNELINVEQQQQFTMLVLFLVCLIIMVWCFYPLMIIGYTTTDDVGISLSNFSDFLKGALSSGRVTWVIAVPFEIAGSMNGDNLLAKMPRMLGLIALLFSIFHLLRELTSDTKFALLTPTLFAALWQNSWQHNGITSYPMLFTLSLACLFLSASLYNRFIKTNNVSMGIASATLLFCSFTSELFVSLAWIHFLIYSSKHSAKA